MATARQRKKDQKRSGKIAGVPSYEHGTSDGGITTFVTGGGWGGSSGNNTFSRGWDSIRNYYQRQQDLLRSVQNDPEAKSLVLQNMLLRQQGIDPAQYDAMRALGGPSLFDIMQGNGGGGAGADHYATDVSAALERRRQDLDVQMANADRTFQYWAFRREQAIRKGELALAREAEANMQKIRLAQQSLDAQRFGLEQQKFALEQNALSLQQQLGAGNLALGLGEAAGNLELQRQTQLRNLLANPRDFAELNIELGGIPALMEGGTPGGQSPFAVTGSPLGDQFSQVLARLQERPEQQYFDMVSDRLGGIPQAQFTGQQAGPPPTVAMQQAVAAAAQNDPALRAQIAANMQAQRQQTMTAAQNRALADPAYKDQLVRAVLQAPRHEKGGSQIIDEPVVGMGQWSGLPKFTMGEGGKPEMMTVTPMATGGTVATKPFFGGPMGNYQPPTATAPTPPTNSFAQAMEPTQEYWQKLAANDDSFNAALRASLAQKASKDPSFAAAILMKPPNPAKPQVDQSGNTHPFAPAEDFFSKMRANTPRSIGPTQPQGGQIGGNFPDQAAPAFFPGLQNFMQFMGKGAVLPKTPGEAIRRLGNYMPGTLLPSQEEVLASIVSSLGFEPTDFFTAKRREMPNQMSFAPQASGF